MAWYLLARALFVLAVTYAAALTRPFSPILPLNLALGAVLGMLILVVEPRATTSAALLASVERAEAVGCRILGIVTQGRSEKLPAWLRQLLNRR